MDARFSDGRSAIAGAVEVEVSAHALTRKDRATGTVTEWQLADLLIADRDARRLTVSSNTDARLTLSDADFDAVVARAPQLQLISEKRKATRLVVMLKTAAAVLAATIYFGIPAAAVPLARITPISYEQQLGRSIDAQLDIAFDQCRPTDREALGFIQTRADQLASSAGIDYPVTVHLIDTEMVNAFALPGGRVWLTKGLLDAADNGDQVGAVLAHEIAHIANRDVMVSLYRALGFGLILDAVIGGGSGAGQQIILLLTNMADLKHSRDVETRADRDGMEMLHATGLTSRGMAGFFETLAAMEDEVIDRERMGDWIELATSHPDTARRVEAAKAIEKDGAPVFPADQWTRIAKVCG